MFILYLMKDSVASSSVQVDNNYESQAIHANETLCGA